MKKLFLLLALLTIVFVGTGCVSREADVASRNISIAADQFEVNRRIIFYNGITNEYMLEIDGLCSLGNYDPAGQLSVTCKVGPGTYKKHFLGLSDNVTYFAEQLDPLPVNSYQYRIIFRPAQIVPNMEIDLP